MATKNSKEYWQDRSIQRLVSSEQLGQAGIAQTLGVYERSLRNIQSEIKSIYDNYSEKGVLNVKELKKAIGKKGEKEFLRKVSASIKELGLDPKKAYDERYLWRLNRLEALQEQVKIEIMALAEREAKITKKTYEKVVKQSYRTSQNDLERQGIAPAFSTLNKDIVEMVISSEWEGGNYSTRVWNNSAKLAIQLPTIIGGALNSGQSYQKTSREIRDKFKVRMFEATRLVRTESNYFHNQAELQSYIDDGIEYYEFQAKLDSRTSKVCERLDDTVYRVDEAIVGENYPPMHPNCRSSTVANFSGKKSFRKQRRYEKRTKRFRDKLAISNDMERRFKSAMQAQMNPNKAVYDYNAELNNITRDFKGEALSKEIAQFMDRVPQDHPLRGGFETIAKLHGWKDDAETRLTSEVNKIFEKGGIDPNEVHLTKQQKAFIAKSKVEFDGGVAEGEITNVGSFDANTNRLSLTSSSLKNYQKYGYEGMYNSTFQHELGHAIDHNARLFNTGDIRFAYHDKFSPLLWDENGFTNEAYSIARYRTMRGLVDKEVQDYFTKIDINDYKSGLLNGGDFKVGKQVYSIPADLRDYYLENTELFAEAYSIFHTNPRYLKSNAPKIYDYINIISSLTL